jgi:CDP-paratose 2-epimerase
MKIIITGGAGFIGCNAAARALDRGDDVVVIDNLSRIGAAANLRWLQSKRGFDFKAIDLVDAEAVQDAFREHRDATRVLHLAGQVAVTTSVTDPRSDFEANALGTFNVLEAVRSAAPEAALVYASTNKVYGGLEHLDVVEEGECYRYGAAPHGVSEEMPLDFHSPYGCSKGAADQYVRDYHRIYGLRTVVFRQSCIYGYRQFGVEDQGWVAWFAISALRGRPMRVYGDGKQVRDVLFASDLVDALLTAWAHADRLRGKAFNIGGGPRNTTSLFELIQLITALHGVRPTLEHGGWRTGDQRYDVSDIRAFKAATGWSPQVGVQAGVTRLYRWLAENRRATAAAIKRVAP